MDFFEATDETMDRQRAEMLRDMEASGWRREETFDLVFLVTGFFVVVALISIMHWAAS